MHCYVFRGLRSDRSVQAENPCTKDIKLQSCLACHSPTRPVWQALMLYLVGSAERPPAASPLLPPAAPLPVDALLSAAGLLSLAQRAPLIKTLHFHSKIAPALFRCDPTVCPSPLPYRSPAASGCAAICRPAQADPACASIHPTLGLYSATACPGPAGACIETLRLAPRPSTSQWVSSI